MRERCRVHHLLFAVSLEGISFCPICRREERNAIDRLIRHGRIVADRTHAILLAESEREQAERVR